ncbi:MAG: UMP kinase [Bacteroidales bacterium]|nr:UMP kinase [Bacteroidales bacterium]
MYNRVLLKLSGESLGGPAGTGINEEWVNQYAQEVVDAVKAGHQVGIVIGGGNIFRGLSGVKSGFDRVDGDKMGMLATIINSLALAMAIRSLGVKAEVFTATPMEPIANYYMRDKAVAVMENGGVALIAGGTGNPFFTTDSGAALRALEIGANALLKGTRVDGVYTADPEKDPSAVKYDELTFDKALGDHLKVMDATAFALCEQGNMPIIVFDMNVRGNLARLLGGDKIGTVVHK